MVSARCVIFVPMLFLCQLISTAQESDVVYEEHTAYREIYKNRITGNAFYVNTYNSLTVSDRNSDLSYELVPNKQDRIGASFAFRFVAFSFSFAPDFLSENKDNEDSRLFNINLRTYFGNHWMQTFDLYNEKGMYLDDGTVEVYLPDSKNLKIGGSTSYIFNENFSFRAIDSQNEKQLKSAGSFIPQVFYYYSRFKLLAENETDRIEEKYYNFDISIGPSYYYNLVPANNLLVSVGGAVGIGLNYSTSDEEKLTSLLTHYDISGTVTYDTNNWYLGARYNYLVLNHNSDRSSYINDNIPFLKAFIGFRFNAPKKWVEASDSIEGKLGF